MIGVTAPIKVAKEQICPSQRNIVKNEKPCGYKKSLKLDLFKENFTVTDAIDVNLNMVSNNPTGSDLQSWGYTLAICPLPLGSRD